LAPLFVERERRGWTREQRGEDAGESGSSKECGGVEGGARGGSSEEKRGWRLEKKVMIGGDHLFEREMERAPGLGWFLKLG
jgi:hypothetical protein